MRCSRAKACVSGLTSDSDLERRPELAKHLGSCPTCAQVWRSQRSMLVALADPSEVPVFGDLAPVVLERLNAGPAARPAGWRWAALAAMALVALALGYLIGIQTTKTTADGMAATYQEAFTTLPTASADLAYFDLSGNAPSPSPVRSSP